MFKVLCFHWGVETTASKCVPSTWLSHIHWGVATPSDSWSQTCKRQRAGKRHCLAECAAMKSSGKCHCSFVMVVCCSTWTWGLNALITHLLNHISYCSFSMLFRSVLLTRDGQGMQMGELVLLLHGSLVILASDVWVAQAEALLWSSFRAE